MLEVRQLTKIYNEQNKVENISFSVQPGQCLALCGGNGAGKSTIIKMLIGQLTPTKGDICVNGKQVKKMRKMVFLYARSFAISSAFNGLRSVIFVRTMARSNS